MFNITRGERSIFLKPKEVKCMITPDKKNRCDITITGEGTTKKRSYENMPDMELIQKIKQLTFDDIESTCNLILRKKKENVIQFDRYTSSPSTVIFHLDDKQVGKITRSSEDDSYTLSFTKRSLTIKKGASYKDGEIVVSYVSDNTDITEKLYYKYCCNINFERLIELVKKYPSFKSEDVKLFLDVYQ